MRRICYYQLTDIPEKTGAGAIEASRPPPNRGDSPIKWIDRKCETGRRKTPRLTPWDIRWSDSTPPYEKPQAGAWGNSQRKMENLEIFEHKGMNESAKKQEQDNLRIWNGVKHVGPKLLKEIKGGNLKGYSDINPLWRVEMLTTAFGPVGFGWNVRETARWTDEYGGELMASVKVELTICVDGIWSQPIEGVGGSKLYGKGKGEGLNDEAWKMATTDAISVACKSLGFAADVYMGRQSHRDADQQGSGGDYGSKYEERNYARNSTRSNQTGGYTAQPVSGQNRAVSAPNGGEYGPGPVYAGNGAPYQAPPPGDPNYVQPSGKRNPHSKVCEVVDVQKGRAVRLINELAKYDYDDPESWAAGLDWLRHEVVLRPGAEEAIVQLAIAKRNDNQSEAARRALS